MMRQAIMASGLKPRPHFQTKQEGGSHRLLQLHHPALMPLVINELAFALACFGEPRKTQPRRQEYYAIANL